MGRQLTPTLIAATHPLNYTNVGLMGAQKSEHAHQELLRCPRCLVHLHSMKITMNQKSSFVQISKFDPRALTLDRHEDETYIRVGGKWRYLWRAIDANGQMVDFRLTARRAAKAAKAFLNKAKSCSSPARFSPAPNNATVPFHIIDVKCW